MAKTGWEYGPIYTASHDPQGRSREVYFGTRARGVKIGRSEERGGRKGEVRMDVENVSNSSEVEAQKPWTLGARSLKKG
jgi:hypothetical protein